MSDKVEQLRRAIHQARARVYRVGEATPLQRFQMEGLPDQV